MYNYIIRKKHDFNIFSNVYASYLITEVLQTIMEITRHSNLAPDFNRNALVCCILPFKMTVVVGLRVVFKKSKDFITYYGLLLEIVELIKVLPRLIDTIL